MATDRAMALFEKVDSFLKPFDSTEVQDAGEAKIMTTYLMDCRRKQKIMCQQLGVLDDMLKLLVGLESAEQFLDEPCPPNPDSKASAPWKALKAEYLEQVQKVESLISTLTEHMDELFKKRQRLEALLVALEKKKEECREQERAALQWKQRAEKNMSYQLEDSIQNAQNALHSCNRRLSELQSQVDEQLSQVANWTSLRHRLQEILEVTQANMQYRLLSVTPSELCLELLPRSTQQSLKPLQLSITTTTEGRFRLQVFQGTAGLLEESVEGPLRELSAALLEVMQRYISQGEMLAEIQALHSRFAIDWCPAKRLLIFLKSATTVCHLELGEGYPSSGRARLLSVRKDGNLLNLSTLQPPVMNPALTDWLEFLSCNPDF
ncbi:ZW10 interactor [Trichomycterus rosablanca]|uniref:ZW10 interactor n=1 Tax=Trichomycterus rosablanca TaxID=2290929 RepID=UPI002F35B939